MTARVIFQSKKATRDISHKKKKKTHLTFFTLKYIEMFTHPYISFYFASSELEFLEIFHSDLH